MRSNIFEEIEKERVYQDNKWGTSFDDENTLNDWTTYITQYASRNAGGSFGRSPSESDWAMYRKDMIKVAAIAVAAVETINRKVGVANES